jgi:hypothetical protein
LGCSFGLKSEVSAAYVLYRRRVQRLSGGVLLAMLLLLLTFLHPLFFFIGLGLALVCLRLLWQAWSRYRPMRRQKQQACYGWRQWVQQTVVDKEYSLRVNTESVSLGQANAEPYQLWWSRCDLIMLRPDFAYLGQRADDKSILLPRAALSAEAWAMLLAAAGPWAAAMTDLA